MDIVINVLAVIGGWLVISAIFAGVWAALKRGNRS